MPEATPRGRYLRSYGKAAHDCPWTAINDGSAGSGNVIRHLPRAFLPVQVPPEASRRVVNFDFLDKAAND